MQKSEDRIKEIRHQTEVERDVYHCAVRYLTSKMIKSQYEREMLDFALQKEQDCNEVLIRKVDF